MLANKPIETQIQEDLSIDETRLGEALQRHASRFFYYGTTWALAVKQAKLSKARTKEVEARLTAGFRKEMLDSGLKHREVTLKMIEDYLAEHPEMKEAEEQLIKDEYVADMLGVAKDAFWQRGRALSDLYKNKGEKDFFEREGFAEMQRQLEEKRGARKNPKETKE